MRFPVAIKKANEIVAYACGCMILIIAVLTVFEAIMRFAFNNPTSWSLNLCTYILVWYAFLASAYSFQAHGHVGVDLFKDWVDKRAKTKLPRRTMAVIGYILSIIYIGVILYGGYLLSRNALQHHQQTAAANPIPVFILTLAVVVGCIWMIVTLVCIIIDLLGKNDEHL